MWRKLRIAILLFILATVAQRAWWQGRDVEWKDNLYVTVHPVNADGSAAVANYIASLSQDDFQPMVDYFAEEGERHGLAIYHPFEVKLGPAISGQPPLPPRGGSMLDVILWSLQFRWWSWRNSPEMPVSPNIRLYLLYHDPAKVGALSHSTALSKGRVGLVNVFGEASYTAQNAVVIAHELLHTLGATDKYDPASNLPRFPAGFADPGKEPLYPQDYAELMAGRLPVSDNRAEIPAGLAQTVIGATTAREIGWIRKE